MGVGRLFFQGRAKFSRGGGKNIQFALKTSKKILFFDKMILVIKAACKMLLKLTIKGPLMNMLPAVVSV